MTYQLIIKGGRILSPGDNVDMIADVAIDDGKIVSIKPEPVSYTHLTLPTILLV